VRTVTRTLIGPADSDHGYDPVHAHAIAAVAVFGDHGYLNFVRMGIPSNRGSNLEVSALPQSGDELVGVAVSSPEMYYVEQDEGIGAEPTLWDLSRSTSRSVVLYFNANSGDLMSVLDLDDDTSAVTTAAAGPVTHEHSGVSTTVRGSFNAVYGPDGELVTDGQFGTVEIDANQGVVRAF